MRSNSRNGQNEQQLPKILFETYDANKGEFLCFFPNGKLEQGEWVDRGPQKGPTCWFYASTNLAWSHTESSQELQIILNYCNATALEHVHHLVASEIARRLITTHRRVDEEQITAMIQQARQLYDVGSRFYVNLEAESKNINWQKVKVLVNQYIVDRSKDEEIEDTEIAKLASDAIKQLETTPIFKKNEGFISRTVRKGAEKLKKNNMLSVASSFLDISSEDAEKLLTNKYHSLIFNTLLNILGITKIEKKDWNDPEELQQALLTHLKKFGPMLAIGEFGITCHQNDPQPLPDKFGTRTLYGWDRNDNEPRNSNHAINVIGLKIDAKDARNSSVIFVDPNDGSKVEGERRAYVIRLRDFWLKLIRMYQCEKYSVPLALFHQQAKEIWIPANVTKQDYVACVKNKLALLRAEIVSKNTWKTFFGERAEPTRHAQQILDIIDNSPVVDWIHMDKQVSALLNNMQQQTWNRTDDTQDFYEHLKNSYDGKFTPQVQDTVNLPGYAEDCHLQKRLREMREIYKTESNWKTHLAAIQELIATVKQSSKVQARSGETSKARFKKHVTLLEEELHKEFITLCQPFGGYLGFYSRKARSMDEVIVYLNEEMNRSQSTGSRLHDNYIRLLATTLKEVYQLDRKSFNEEYFNKKALMKQMIDGVQSSNRYKFEAAVEVRPNR